MDLHLEIENSLAAFSFGQRQDCATLIQHLERHGISIDDFLVYVKEERRRQVRERKRIEAHRAKIERRLPKCLTCGIPMVLREAHPPDPGTNDPGDPSEGSHWTCPKCRFGKYDPRPMREVQMSISQ